MPQPTIDQTTPGAELADALDAALTQLRHDVARESYAAQWAVARFTQSVADLRLREHLTAGPGDTTSPTLRVA